MLNTVSVSLNLDHLRHNYRVAKMMAVGAQVFAVLKSDAYGHGVLNIALGLPEADGFALLQMDDALTLRDAGFSQPILMMAGVNDVRELVEACAYNLTLVVRSHRQLVMLLASQMRDIAGIWIKVKSSINRFGFDPLEVSDVLEKLKERPDIRFYGLMMHFASSDDLDHEIDGQWEAFRSLVARTGLPFSAANSAAMLRDARTHGTLVRLGSALYGNNPFVGGKAFEALKRFGPVMRLEARIVGTVDLAAGEPLGYGGVFVADRPMRVGVVGCGYGDGYPSSATTGTPVMIRGIRTRILGGVAMNVIFVDLGPVADAKVDDWVTLWGDELLRIDEVAQNAGMSPEAIQCGLTKKHHIHLVGQSQVPLSEAIQSRALT